MSKVKYKRSRSIHNHPVDLTEERNKTEDVKSTFVDTNVNALPVQIIHIKKEPVSDDQDTDTESKQYSQKNTNVNALPVQIIHIKKEPVSDDQDTDTESKQYSQKRKRKREDENLQNKKKHKSRRSEHKKRMVERHVNADNRTDGIVGNASSTVSYALSGLKTETVTQTTTMKEEPISDCSGMDGTDMTTIRPRESANQQETNCKPRNVKLEMVNTTIKEEARFDPGYSSLVEPTSIQQSSTGDTSNQPDMSSLQQRKRKREDENLQNKKKHKSRRSEHKKRMVERHVNADNRTDGIVGNASSTVSYALSGLKTETVTQTTTMKEEPISDCSGMDGTDMTTIRPRESANQQETNCKPRNVKLEMVNTTIKEEARFDPGYSSLVEPTSIQQSSTGDTSNQPDMSSLQQSIKTEKLTQTTIMKAEPISDCSSMDEADITTLGTRESSNQQETNLQQRNIKLEMVLDNTTIKEEARSDSAYSSLVEPTSTQQSRTGETSSQAEMSPQQQDQATVSGIPDIDEDEQEFQLFAVRAARRMDAKQHFGSTCRSIEHHHYCTNMKAYLNMIHENLPPDEYHQTAIMKNDPFFDEQKSRLTNEPNLKTMYAMLHHKGIITRKDMCCISHPLSSGSTQLFVLMEILKRKPNGRADFENAVLDCLQEELLLDEEPFDLTRLSRQNALCFGDLKKIEEYLALKYSSKVDCRTEVYFSLLLLAAAEVDVTLYKHLEMFLLGGRDDQEKCLFIQNYRDTRMNTVLHVAAEHNNTEVCGYICSHYPHLTRCRNAMNQEPIHLAIASNKADTNCLMLLIEACDNIGTLVSSVTDGILAQDLQRLLFLSYKCDNVTAVKYIFQTYPDLRNHKAFLGRLPIHCAAACNGLDCFRYLEGLTIKDLSVVKGCDIFKQLTDNHGSNVLHIACESASIAIIRHIVRQYPELLHVKSKEGMEPIHYTVQSQTSLQTFMNVFDCLNENQTEKENLNYIITARDENEDTILHQACRLGRTDIVATLLQRFSSLSETKGFNGTQLLHSSAMSDGTHECFQHVLNISIQSGNTIDSLEISKDDESNIALHTAQLVYLSKTRDRSNNSVLHTACFSGRLDIVKYLIEMFPSVTELRGCNGRLPIHDAACKDGSLQCFQYILDLLFESKNIEDQLEFFRKTRDHHNNTILHVACSSGRKDIAKYLLTRYPLLIDLRGCKGRLPIHEAACKDGSLECFQYILESIFQTINVEDRLECLTKTTDLRNKNVLQNMLQYLSKTRNDDNDTVLHTACLSNRKDVVQYLLTNYPSLIHEKGFRGNQPLFSTVESNGSLECFKFVFNVLFKDKSSKEKLDYLKGTRNDDNDTVLHLGCLLGRKDVVDYLLTNYPSLIRDKGFRGNQPLFSTAYRNGSLECFQCVLDLLLKHKSAKTKLDYLKGTRNDDNDTVLHVGCLSGRKDVVDYLLTNYPSLIREKGCEGYQPLFSSAGPNGSLECFQCVLDLLIKHKSAKTKLDYLKGTGNDDNITVLHVGCLSGRKDVVDYLLTNYPSLIRGKGFRGNQLLFFSAGPTGSLECFEFVFNVLFKDKSSKEKLDYLKRTRNDNNDTVLHVGCLWGRKDVVDYLLTNYPSLIREKGCEGYQPLFSSAGPNGSLECFQCVLDFLLKHKSAKEKLDYLKGTRNDDNDTVLHVGCLSGRKDVVDYLLTNYTSLIHEKGFRGNQPLFSSAGPTGSLECFQFAFNVLFKDKSSKEKLDYLKGTRNDDNDTVLHVGCLSGRKDVVDYLLTNYTSLIREKGCKGYQPLFSSAGPNGSLECFQCVLDFLLKHKSAKEKLDYLKGTRNDDNDTVLHVGCLSGRKDVVDYLLTNYPSLIREKGYKGYQPLFSSAGPNGSLECFQCVLDFLLKHKSAKEKLDYLKGTRNDDNDTVLHVGCLSGRKDVVDYLLTNYPSLIHEKGYKGYQPLFSTANPT